MTVSVLFVGKRFYTNRDGLHERYGRIYQLPFHWQASGIAARLWMIDYHTPAFERRCDDGLSVASTPVFSLSMLRQWRSETTALRKAPRELRLVVASGDCYVGLLGYRIARSTGAKYVFDVYDKYDEFSGYRRLPGFDPFRFLLRRADHRFFASNALADEMGGPSTIVPNGIDTRLFRELDKAESRTALGLPRHGRLVGYFGSMEPDRGIDDLVAALGVLRARGEPVELLIAGKRREGLDLEQPGVRYLGNLPHDRIPVALASCDVLTLPYRRSPFLDMASSCKIAEYLAARRPIVATRTPNLLRNFPEQAAQLGCRLVEPGDVAAMAEALQRQLTEPVMVEDVKGWAWEDIAGMALDGILMD